MGKNRAWTAAEKKKAMKMWRDGIRSSVIAKKLDRSRDAICHYARNNRSDFPARQSHDGDGALKDRCFNIVMAKDMLDELKLFSKRTGVPMTAIARNAIRNYMDGSETK